jgi:C4-dicarboxylate transporter
MLRKMFASVAVVLAAGALFASPLTPIGEAHAADKECKADADCGEGMFCIVALTPHVCKAPMPTGSACKRDVVCQSKKCDIPAGKEAGVCK